LPRRFADVVVTGAPTLAPPSTQLDSDAVDWTRAKVVGVLSDMDRTEDSRARHKLLKGREQGRARRV